MPVAVRKFVQNSVFEAFLPPTIQATAPAPSHRYSCEIPSFPPSYSCTLPPSVPPSQHFIIFSLSSLIAEDGRRRRRRSGCCCCRYNDWTAEEEEERGIKNEPTAIANAASERGLPYVTSAVGGGGRGSPKSRRKEQNQLICDSDKGAKKSEHIADVIDGSPKKLKRNRRQQKTTFTTLTLCCTGRCRQCRL